MLDIYIYIYLNHKEMHFFFCTEDYIEDQSLKSKGHFHILQVTFQKKSYLLDFSYNYFCLNYKMNSLCA